MNNTKEKTITWDGSIKDLTKKICQIHSDYECRLLQYNLDMHNFKLLKPSNESSDSEHIEYIFNNLKEFFPEKKFYIDIYRYKGNIYVDINEIDKNNNYSLLKRKDGKSVREVLIGLY